MVSVPFNVNHGEFRTLVPLVGCKQSSSSNLILALSAVGSQVGTLDLSFKAEASAIRCSNEDYLCVSR
jgi:hypothetical protein